jgi:hypothetical protein
LLRTADREALWVWLLGIVAVWSSVAWGLPKKDFVHVYLQQWFRWDSMNFIEIARFGYEGNPAIPDRALLKGFFPGLPLMLRVVHAFVPDWTAAGLLISLVAGMVTCVALSRLGEAEGPKGTGIRAVLAMLLSPAAIFLFAAYTEGVFLAFALPCWLWARKGRWGPAALCCAGAASVRISGIFLALALIVAFLTWPEGLRALPRPWPRAGWRTWAWLLVPFLPPLAFSFHLWRMTGDWLSYQHTQQLWPAHATAFTPPWDALRESWRRVGVDAAVLSNALLEAAAAAVGMGLACWLLARRRWAELTFVGLHLAVLLTSTFYISLPRYMLSLWPLWIALGILGARKPRLYAVILALSAPVMVMMAKTFLVGGWAG